MWIKTKNMEKKSQLRNLLYNTMHRKSLLTINLSLVVESKTILAYKEFPNFWKF